MILDSFKLNGKVALVTGASAGLGSAIAVALAEAGADVAAHGNSRAPDATCELIERTRAATLWSALTCQRFGLRRLDAAGFDATLHTVAATGRDRTKAVTGHRTPKS